MKASRVFTSDAQEQEASRLTTWILQHRLKQRRCTLHRSRAALLPEDTTWNRQSKALGSHCQETMEAPNGMSVLQASDSDDEEEDHPLRNSDAFAKFFGCASSCFGECRITDTTAALCLCVCV